MEGFFQPEQVELLEEELELSNIRVSQEILSNRQSSMLQSTVSLGHCTGAFVSKDGLVLTNKHCLAQDANLIQNHSPPKEQNQEFPLQNTEIFVLIPTEMSVKMYCRRETLKKTFKSASIKSHDVVRIFVTSFPLTTIGIHS